MAELQLGANSEVILYGLHDSGLEKVKEQFSNRGVDLSPLYKPGGAVDIVRGMDHVCTDPADPQWVEAVDELYGEVQSAKESIDGIELKHYELARIGLAALNPDFTSPIRKERKDGSTYVQAFSQRKYNFLSRQALTGLVLPMRKRFTAHRLENMSVVLQLTEPPDLAESNGYGYYQSDPRTRYSHMPANW